MNSNIIRVKRLCFQYFLKFFNLIPPEKSLNFLLRLDNWLYFLQGQAAIKFGNGVHPKHRLTNYHKFFYTRIHSNDRVLDAGCGVGYLAYDIAEKSGAFVWGVDINPKNISQARERFNHPNIKYQVSDIKELSPDPLISVIVLSNVLEHLSNRPQILIRMQKDFNPSKFLIRVPLFERDWRVPLKQELGVEWRLDPTHQTEYTIETFKNEILQSGMRINHMEIHWGEIWGDVRAVPSNLF